MTPISPKPTEIEILSAEVLSDIRAAAWLEAELHPELDLHRRHQMADICEPAGSLDRVWRTLGVALADVRLHLHPILLEEPGFRSSDVLWQWESAHFRFEVALHGDTAAFLREKIHEFLVARAMAEAAADIIPSSASVWNARASTARAAVAAIARSASAVRPSGRPLCPV